MNVSSGWKTVHQLVQVHGDPNIVALIVAKAKSIPHPDLPADSGVLLYWTFNEANQTSTETSTVATHVEIDAGEIDQAEAEGLCPFVQSTYKAAQGQGNILHVQFH